MNYVLLPSAKIDKYNLNVEFDANNDNEFDDTNEGKNVTKKEEEKRI